MRYFDSFQLLKPCYFDEKYSEFVPEMVVLEKVD